MLLQMPLFYFYFIIYIFIDLLRLGDLLCVSACSLFRNAGNVGGLIFSCHSVICQSPLGGAKENQVLSLQ